MKKNDTSERLLRLIEILQAKTDPEHLLTMPALISELEAYGIHSDRRSIYKQLHLLKESGYPIHYTRKGQGYYFAHPFNESEVFLLMDAIQHIKALTNESTKSKNNSPCKRNLPSKLVTYPKPQIIMYYVLLINYYGRFNMVTQHPFSIMIYRLTNKKNIEEIDRNIPMFLMRLFPIMVGIIVYSMMKSMRNSLPSVLIKWNSYR